MRIAKFVDQWLTGKSARLILCLAVLVVAAIGYVDYVSGHEISLGFFYIAPVALAAWYVGRRAGISISLACSVAFFLADSGHVYSHPAVQGWNALIRLGFFLVSSLLLSSLRASLSRQQALARTDSLTGLLTRRAFDDQFEHDLLLAQRMKQAITLAYIDLDDFKRVNDEQGHAEGDRVLRITADVMRRMLRRADTIARLGGDEFALVLPNTDEQAAREVVAGITRELSTALHASGHELGCSVGVITIVDANLSMEAAVRAADELMYGVKRNGKGNIAYMALSEPTPPPGVQEAAPKVRR
jgi:diguanylate cyclase (GGDEF)-like protein